MNLKSLLRDQTLTAKTCKWLKREREVERDSEGERQKERDGEGERARNRHTYTHKETWQLPLLTAQLIAIEINVKQAGELAQTRRDLVCIT